MWRVSYATVPLSGVLVGPSSTKVKITIVNAQFMRYGKTCLKVFLLGFGEICGAFVQTFTKKQTKKKTDTRLNLNVLQLAGRKQSEKVKCKFLQENSNRLSSTLLPYFSR